MTLLYVDRGKLRGNADTVKKIGGKVKTIGSDLAEIGRNLDWDIRSKEQIDRIIKTVTADLEEQTGILQRMESFLAEAIQAYDKLDEGQMQKLDGILTGTTITPGNRNDLSDIFKWFAGSPFLPILISNPQLRAALLSQQVTQSNLLNARSDAGASAGQAESGGKSSSATAQPGYELSDTGVDAYLAKAVASDEEGIAQGEASAHAGRAAAEYEYETSLWTDENKFNPAISVGAGARVSAGEAEASGSIGNDKVAVTGGAKANVLSAEADAGVEFNIAKGEVNAHAGAHASVVSGELSTGFQVLGYEIELTGSGHAVGVGAQAEIGRDNGKFKIGAKASAFLGLGFEVSIGKK
ncbi:hypothetical protein ACFFSY_03545 [Paenibacillus aurantiacus]|uniref:WXG100 family type VII secretion target n=1 Tax=Paenibacillus aurantiacus TaxID=1936118 RepID=A0ABV5KIK2_9BACL